MNIRFSRTCSVSVGVLLFAVAISVIFGMRSARTAAHADLIEQVPKHAMGWDVRDMPIASSAEMQRAVDEMLNYDSALFREFSSGEKRLSVYVGYWRPHKFHPRLIAIHTPDVCWVGAGWLMKSVDYAHPVTVREAPLWAAQFREFSTSGRTEFVLYWHIVDGRPSAYVGGPKAFGSSFFRAFWQDLQQGAGEQFFIRISSPQPWGKWNEDPLFQEILQSLAPVLTAESTNST